MYRKFITKLSRNNVIKNSHTFLKSPSRRSNNISNTFVITHSDCNFYSTTATNQNNCKLTQTTEQNGIREIMLNDPKTRNSLSMAMMTELYEEISQDNENTRVIVLKATSDTKVFSAGHNLKEFNTNNPQLQKDIFHKLTCIILAIQKSPVPIIAQVNGLATAAGCQLVASCDILICSDTSSFSLPGAEVGIFCSTPGVAVSRVMPRMKSSFMLFSGLPFTAQEAHIAGLVSRVVCNDQLDEEVMKICNSIKRKSRKVIQLGKEFYYRQLNLPIVDAYQAGEKTMIANLQTNDGQEGIRSFIEKRPPIWTNS